ncbi:hypothetical protein KGF57_004092 [Candida theae]|uniref:Uncharacterized protein n=1 Tax=Candida theae TaxID=1198502 RepID=A0AAD5BBV3_9ASCO|nr:uncharacterized protein KGF57_004092 [Candida theae]KAI5952976.1 hypothetical protein KGF57_004092 [Candida theae]
MARKADLLGSGGDSSRRSTIHNASSQTVPQDISHEGEPPTSSQLQQCMTQNKVLTRRNGILSLRITELEDKVTQLNDEISRLRKNDSLKTALELVEKNLVNSFNVSMKQLQRIRVDNGLLFSGDEPSAASKGLKNVFAKNDKIRPSMSRQASEKAPITNSKSPMTSSARKNELGNLKNRGSIEHQAFEIPQFFKRADEHAFTDKFSAISVDESDSEDVSDMRQVGVFAKERTIVVDEDSDSSVCGTESPNSPTTNDVLGEQMEKGEVDKSDFLTEFGRHESSFVVESETRKSNGGEVESTPKARKSTSAIPDMSDYEALLDSLKCNSNLKETGKEDNAAEGARAEVAIMDNKTGRNVSKSRTRSSKRLESKLNLEDEEITEKSNDRCSSGDEIDKDKRTETERIPNETISGRSGLRSASPKSSLPANSKQERQKKIQIKEDSPTVGSEGDVHDQSIESKAGEKDISRTNAHEIIELDQSPDRHAENNAISGIKSGKRKPLSTLSSNVSKPSKKRKQTSRSKHWDLDIFDLRNA